MNPISFLKAVSFITKLQGLLPMLPQALLDYEGVMANSKDPIAESVAVSKFMDDFKAAFSELGLPMPPTQAAPQAAAPAQAPTK